MRYPAKLKKGDTIGLVCTSSAVDKAQEARCRALLEGMGCRVKTADNLTDNYAGYMAGSGAKRGWWINAMFADPEIDAIFCVRGGHGGSRVMEYLDLDMIRQNPKIFVGYSDVTSLHLAFTQGCGFITFHGPMVSSNMVSHFDEETAASFFQALNADEAYEFQNPKGVPISVLKAGKDGKSAKAGNAGKVRGPLTGGNLSLLAASIGTPYEVDTKGKILFIEEVGETISRIERFAYQLRNAGKFRECAGVLLGQFSDCTNKEQPDYTEQQCLLDALEGLDIPVLGNVQSGHGHPMMTLPLGAMCEVDTEKPRILFEVPKGYIGERG